LWTVTNFSIRESHEIFGNQSGDILEKMESHFLSGLSLSARLLFFRSISYVSQDALSVSFTRAISTRPRHRQVALQ
jgi:hypothetical protein